MRVCVYGAASQQIHRVYLEAAFSLGKSLGESGCTLVFGAGDTGVMGACARGAKEAGGEIIGIAPRFFDQPGVLYPHCTELIFTDTMRARKEKMEALSHCFVMAPGGIGTLEEFFEILTLRQLGRHQKPIFILNTRGYYRSLYAMLRDAVEQGFLGQDGLELFQIFDSPEELTAGIRKALG